MKRIPGLLGFLLCIALMTTMQAQSGYKISGTIEIGGDARWDYLSVDTSSNRLFVSQGNRVAVIDLQTKAVVGEIAGLQGVHGIACAPAAGKGYISNGKDNSVTVFDLKTLNKLKHIEITGKKPDAILFDSFSGRVFTMNGGSANATAIDVATDSIVGTVLLAKGPEFAVTDGKGKIFVNSEDENVIVMFDAVSLKQLQKWSIMPCESPSGLAFDVTHKRLFSTGSNNKLAVVDAETGKVLSILPIGKGVDGAAFDPALGLAFTSNGEGTITVIKEKSPSDFSVLETVTSLPRARTITVDPRNHNLYLSTLVDGKDGKKTFGVVILSNK